MDSTVDYGLWTNGVRMSIKLGVSGALGRMGSRILTLASEDKDLQPVLALERAGHPQLGADSGGLRVVSDVMRIKDVDVLVEFSSPEATIEHLRSAIDFRTAMVIGTTGFTEAEKKAIARATKKIAVVLSPNMSIGVNCLFHLVREAASRLPAGYAPRITETHHVHKKDAPSGTAKFLGEIIATERKTPPVEIKSVREGEIIGDHDVIFESPWDAITLTHHARTRDIFVLGALEAAKFVAGKKKGLFGMADVLKQLKT